MATNTTVCTRCKTNRANLGYKWCEACYTKSRSGPLYSHCRHCGKSPNPGFDLCDFCHKKDKLAHKPRGKLCLICTSNWAESGIDLCKGCLTSLDNPTGPLWNQVCNKCNSNPPNPGYLVCERCFRNEQAMNMHESFFNGIAQTHLVKPIIGGFRSIVPVDFPPNIIYSDYALSTDSSSPERDSTTLLNMGSTYVTTKQKQKKTDASASDTDYYHCICPDCYSDTSRVDLYYCVACLLSVVQLGDNICGTCRDNLK